jgi:hypothetical protein
MSNLAPRQAFTKAVLLTQFALEDSSSLIDTVLIEGMPNDYNEELVNQVIEVVFGKKVNGYEGFDAEWDKQKQTFYALTAYKHPQVVINFQEVMKHL